MGRKQTKFSQKVNQWDSERHCWILVPILPWNLRADVIPLVIGLRFVPMERISFRPVAGDFCYRSPLANLIDSARPNTQLQSSCGAATIEPISFTLKFFLPRPVAISSGRCPQTGAELRSTEPPTTLEHRGAAPCLAAMSGRRPGGRRPGPSQRKKAAANDEEVRVVTNSAPPRPSPPGRCLGHRCVFGASAAAADPSPGC